MERCSCIFFLEGTLSRLLMKTKGQSFNSFNLSQPADSPVFFRSNSSFFISSALVSGPIFSFSVTSGATTPLKLYSTRGTSGCEGHLYRLASCKVYHICCMDTEEDQQDLRRFYPCSNLSQSIMLLLSSK